jgi:3-oxoacyl-[acyl-carrier protein] reductase
MPSQLNRGCEEPIMDLGLTDRAFLVTAASSGLGRATAEQLVAEGARVVLVARRATMLAEAVSQMGPDRAVALPADLTDPNTAETACALALDTFGRLDGALISVGGPPAGSVLGTTEEQWRTAFDSVFLAALRVCGAVIRHGTANDLCIAWVLSTSAKAPVAGLATSNGLRPGLAMLVKQLADELSPQGTRVIGLMPGAIETERTQYLNSLKDDPAAARASAEAAIPLRRYGQPEEFGRVAAFLLSPAASYLTGSVIPVEGGAQRGL